MHILEKVFNRIPPKQMLKNRWNIEKTCSSSNRRTANGDR